MTQLNALWIKVVAGGMEGMPRWHKSSSKANVDVAGFGGSSSFGVWLDDK